MKIQVSKLIGEEMIFTVRHRILNIILLFAMGLSILTGIFSYILNLNSIVLLISIGGSVLSGGCYYLSLYRKEYLWAAFIVVFFGIIVLLPLLWIFNGGLFGCTVYYILLFSTMGTTLFTGKIRVAVLLLIIVIALLLSGLEYKHPEWIVGYSSRFEQFTDIAFTLIMELVVNAVFIALILNFYLKEQSRSRQYLAQIERTELEIKFQNDLRLINEKLEQEIEERKQAEVSLVQSERLFAKTFAASPIPMFILSAASKKFLDVNDSFVEVFACLRKDVVIKSVTSVIGCAELDNYLSQVINEKIGIHNVDITFYTTSGDKRTGLLSVERADLNGDSCLLCTINDITERAEMLKKMAHLDRLNLVGEMAASIGHEVRNPLTTVRGFLQMFQKNQAFAQKTEHFGIMIEELDRANSIITEFLSLAKNKRIDLDRRSLNEIISKLYPLLQADALSSGKTVLLDLGEVPELLLDENEIRQCILNLVRNGLEAVTAKGHVMIRTYQEADSTILAIQDDGAGIPPEVMAKFGTPFLTTKDKGTGLGIPICYRIAQRHHAEIEINTGKEGTVFLLKFCNI